MKHRGEILKNAIEASGMQIDEISKLAGVHRSTIYRLFEQPDVKLNHLVKIGKAIGYDFSNQIPELANLKKPTPEEQENLNYKLLYFETLEKLLKVYEEKEQYLKSDPSKKKSEANRATAVTL